MADFFRQYTGPSADGSKAAIGPALYDRHSYYSCVASLERAHARSFGYVNPHNDIKSSVRLRRLD